MLHSASFCGIWRLQHIHRVYNSSKDTISSALRAAQAYIRGVGVGWVGGGPSLFELLGLVTKNHPSASPPLLCKSLFAALVGSFFWVCFCSSSCWCVTATPCCTVYHHYTECRSAVLCYAVSSGCLQAMVSLTNIIPTVTEKEACYLAAQCLTVYHRILCDRSAVLCRLHVCRLWCLDQHHSHSD
jgi:hypothetical protein